jgi:hypothetical protein
MCLLTPYLAVVVKEVHVCLEAQSIQALQQAGQAVSRSMHHAIALQLHQQLLHNGFMWLWLQVHQHLQ